MTKYEKALATLKEYCDGFFLQGSLKIIEELVDKATPKPLVEKWAWNCQTCGKGFVNHGGNQDKHCSNCGQRLAPYEDSV